MHSLICYINYAGGLWGGNLEQAIIILAGMVCFQS